jgi:hypothetical protein
LKLPHRQLPLPQKPLLLLPPPTQLLPQRPPLTQLHLPLPLLTLLLQTPPRLLPTLPPRKPPSSNPAFAGGTGLGLCCEKTASFGLRFFFVHQGPVMHIHGLCTTARMQKSHRQVNARWLQARAAAAASIPT